MRKKLEDRQQEIIVLGLAIGIGFILGTRFQKKINLRTLNALKKTTVTLVKETNPLFPMSMPIEEIKKVLSVMPGVTVLGEAVIAEIDGLERWIIR